VDAQNAKGTKNVIKTWSRRSTIILTSLVNLCGARRPQARPVFVSEAMVGHKLGELRRRARSVAT